MDVVGEAKDGFDQSAELLTAVGVYLLLVQGGRRALFEEGFARFPIDPVAWQYRPQTACFGMLYTYFLSYIRTFRFELGRP